MRVLGTLVRVVGALPGLQAEAARCYRCSGKASVDTERCVDCGMCWEHCNYGAVELKMLDQPIIHAVTQTI